MRKTKLPLLGTAATELAFSHIRKSVRKNEYSQFIGNHVGKEKNTMYIIKWFIEKAKQLVRSIKNRKWNKQVEKEYTNLLNDPNLTEEKYRQWCLDLTDEDLRQEALENERIYLEQCNERDDRQAKMVEEIQQIERLSEQAEQQHPLCQGCHKVWCECIICHDESEL